eukprot:tig00001094_g6977.t1
MSSDLAYVSGFVPTAAARMGSIATQRVVRAAAGPSTARLARAGVRTQLASLSAVESVESRRFEVARRVHASAVAPAVRRTVQAVSAAPAKSKGGEDAPEVEARPIKAFINYKYIRDNLQLVKDTIKKRAAVADADKVVALYDQFSKLDKEVDALRQKRNENAAALKGKVEAEKRAALVEEGKRLKTELAGMEERLTALEVELQREALRIPNDLHPDAPVGPEDAAVQIKLVGEKPTFSFPVKDHTEIGERLGLIDFESGAKVAGQKFYYLTNGAALLELGLVNWAMQKLAARGFTPILTPDLVRSHVVEGCGFQPRGENTQVYSVAGMDLCLIGTAEISIGGFLANETFPREKLPLKYAGFSHCFRTEAGAAGSASKGLYRVHQFSKVEMFAVTTPEESEAMHAELREIEEEIFTELGLHFQVLDMATEDLGAPAYRKFDVEAWMPGMERYGEISSTSNCTDYQSRRLNIRYKDESGQNRFAHTLNGTAIAVPRIIVSILENFQQEDGSVIVPPVLRPFIGGIERLTPPAK